MPTLKPQRYISCLYISVFSPLFSKRLHLKCIIYLVYILAASLSWGVVQSGRLGDHLYYFAVAQEQPTRPRSTQDISLLSSGLHLLRVCSLPLLRFLRPQTSLLHYVLERQLGMEIECSAIALKKHRAFASADAFRLQIEMRFQRILLQLNSFGGFSVVCDAEIFGRLADVGTSGRRQDLVVDTGGERVGC